MLADPPGELRGIIDKDPVGWPGLPRNGHFVEGEEATVGLPLLPLIGEPPWLVDEVEGVLAGWGACDPVTDVVMSEALPGVPMMLGPDPEL